MPDILSQGQDSEPGPRRPWRRLALASLAVAALATLIVTRLPGHHAPARPAAHPASQAPPSPSPLAGVALPDEPAGLTGPTAAWDASLRLPVAGIQPAWFYPASGRRVPITGLPQGETGYTFTRAVGGWAISAAPPASCAPCASLPVPVWFLADGASGATRTGSANRVAPGARPGTVWLTTYPTDAAAAPGTARLAAADGRALTPPVQLPSGYAIVAGTVRGLLLAPVAVTAARTADRLWDPATGRTNRRLTGVIAASATRIAWQEPRRLHLLDLPTGQSTTIPLGPGSAIPAAAFSPDGDYLALQVTSPSGGNSGSAPTRLEVAGPASRRLSPVPDTSVSSDALAGFGWPGGQDRLVAELSFTTKVQVAAWRPGAVLLAVAAVAPSELLGSVVTG